jgi:hypothetical protein
MKRQARVGETGIDAAYLTNLTPKECPRRQTTWQWRPVLASREKASRMRPDSTLESDTESFAPVADMSCTTHWRVAKPPSKVTHPVCCTDLRTSRFLAAGTMLFRLEMIVRAFLSERTLKTVANYRSERGTLLANISCQDGPAPLFLTGKPAFARLARARKRHYTFARWSSAVFLVKPAR